MRLISVTPWSRVNDDFLDHTIAYSEPDHDVSHSLVEDQGPTLNRKKNPVYEHIALDIVSESVFDYPYPLITEKTLRPIAHQRMFIIMGPAGMLAVLHALGFLTWYDIVDETYDTIQDPRKRFHAVVQTVRDFCNRDIDDIKQFLETNQYRLQHNFNNLKNLRERELQILKTRLDQQ